MSHGFNLAVMTLFLAATPPATIRGVAAAPALQLTPSQVVGGNPVNGIVSLAAAAPSGGTPVTISTSSILTAPLADPSLGPSSAVTSVTLLIPQGQTSATFRVNTGGVVIGTTATITAVAGGESTTATLTVAPASVLSVAVSPNSVTGGQPVGATVTLDGKTPPSGATLNVTATVPNFVPGGNQFPVRLPVSVPMNPGAVSTIIPVQTFAVSSPSSVIISASLGRTVTGTFTILPATPPTTSSIQVNPAVVLGGKPSTGTVVLTAPAPASGLAITLVSSSSDVVMPASITVPAGSDRQTFQITTRAVATAVQAKVSALASVTGSSSGRVSTPLTVLEQPRLQSIVAQPSGLVGGSPVTIVATYTTSQLPLSSAAMTTYAGAITASTNHPELVQVPQTFSVASATTGFIATASAHTNAPPADQSVAVTVAMGTASGSANFIVRAPVPPIAALTVTPQMANSGATMTLNILLAAAVTTSQTIQLTTDHPEIISLPASVVVVPGRAFSLAFTVRSVTSQTNVTITASAGTQRVQSIATIVR